ncbi:hypothetical protein CK203_034573 [Vitis vinifera]|uniref:Uncharacterized protein n=1 Tax=Vitis vinifera TaxID=29760 RepID=A0A438IDR2_VITVI|nr:hypothetical protein CK203_034573 [Vitis vinifera]
MVLKIYLRKDMLWRKLIVGNFGEEPGGWCSKEGREGHGVGLWKCTKKDGELLKPKQDLRFRGEEDKMVWKASKNGVFSMRSFYDALEEGG